MQQKRKFKRKHYTNSTDNQYSKEDDLYQRLNKRIPLKLRKTTHSNTQKYGENYIPSLEAKTIKQINVFKSTDSFTK